MSDIAESLHALRQHGISHQPHLRRLLEFENWMMPMNEGVDSFGPFTMALPQLIPGPRGKELLLYADYDAQYALADQFQSSGGLGFANPTGWQIFSVALDGVDAVVFDRDTDREFVMTPSDFAVARELAAAVEVECAWQRLRKGNENPGDLDLVVNYGHYHLGVAKRDEENYCFCEVSNDDGRGFIALFTHKDAINLGWPEIAERYAGKEPKQASASGPQILPTLANEPTSGFVLNYNGPCEPAVFSIGVFEILLEALSRSSAGSEKPASDSEKDLSGVVNEVAELSNEGVALGETSRTEEAEDLLRRALTLAEEKLGDEHPSTTACLNNLGNFLSQNQRLEEAVPVLQRAIAAQEKSAGPETLETATTMNNLALALRRMRRFEEAEPLYRRVLPIFENGHGPESAEVAGVLNNLAQVLAHTGRSGEAEPVMRRVITLFEGLFGRNHPNVAIALNNLARLLEDSGRAADAEPLSRRHLEIFIAFERETGDPHAYKNQAIQGYGDLLAGMGWKNEDIRERIGFIFQGREVPPVDATAPGAHASAADGPDFDRLSKFANDAGASMSDQEALFGAAFRLKEWHFIARGEIPDVKPYVASNPTIVSGAPMLKAFTDTKRLQAFATENNLTGPDGSVSILSLPVANLLPTMAAYAESGVTHIHFNADDKSYGFYVPLVQLPIIRAHLEKKRLL